MKKNFFTALMFVALSLSFTRVMAQAVNTDMEAIVFNGKIAIQVKDALSTINYFSLGVNGQVEISFYFGIDDSRNGIYLPGIKFDPGNALVIKGGTIRYVECEKIMSGQLTIIINGLTCIFQNGILVSSNTCSPWANYYGDDADCASYFVSSIKNIAIKRLTKATI